MPINPNIFETSINGRNSGAVSDLQRRVAVLERGGSNSVSSTTITGSVEDATTIRKGKLMLAGDIAGSASSVLVRKLTSLQTSAITDRILEDKAHGLYIGQADGEGLRWTVAHGTVASGPVNVPSPSYSFSRYMTHTGSEDGTTSHRYSTLSVYNQATSTSKAQPTGIYIQSLTESTQARSGTLVNPDATAFLTYAKVQGSGVGWAVGAAMYADNTSAAGDGVTGCEIGPQNNSTNITQTVVGGGVAEKSIGIWLHAGAGSRNIAAGIQFGSLANTRKFDTGIYFTAAGAQGNPVVTSSYRDDGNAVTSLDIRGTHTNAINIASGAGMVKDLNGDNQLYWGNDTFGQRWDIRHGTSAAKVTTAGPTVKISRYEEYGTLGGLAGATSWEFAGMTIVNRAGTGSKAQPTALALMAQSASTQAKVVDTSNPDSFALIATGLVSGSNTAGRGGGAYIEGCSTVAGNTNISGVEVQSRNLSGTDVSYNPAGGDQAMGVWIVAGGNNRSSSAISIGTYSGSAKWDVGIGFRSNSPIVTASIHDCGNAQYSYHAEGLYSVAAIATAPQSGKVLFGVESTSFDTRCLIRPALDTDCGLIVQGCSATQSEDIFKVTEGASGASFFAIDPDGKVLAGVPTTAQPTKALIRSIVDTDSALIVQACSATQSAEVFKVADGVTAASLLTVGPTGRVGIGQTSNTYRLSFPAATTAVGGIDFGGDTNLFRNAADTLRTDDAFQVGGTLTLTGAASFASSLALTDTSGNGFLTLFESSTPTTPAATDRLKLFAAAGTGTATVLKAVDGAGTVTTFGAAGAGGITTATDSAHIDFTVTGTDITGTLLTTATPQFARLGLNIAADATAGLTLDATNSTSLASNSIIWGTDANQVRLQRGANDVLYSPDSFGLGVTGNPAGAGTVGIFLSSVGNFQVGRANSANQTFASLVDTTNATGARIRFRLDNSTRPSIDFGPGSTVPDVSFHWLSAGVLAIDSGANTPAAAHLSFPVAASSIKFDLGGFISAANAGAGLKIGNATNDKLGFYGLATPIVQQTGVAVTAAGIHAALVNLGLITA